MKRSDVVFHSEKNVKKIRDFLTKIFPCEKYILYNIDNNELKNQCWFDSFNYLIIDCIDDNFFSNYTEIISKINENILIDRRFIVFSRELENILSHFYKVKFEIFNENMAFGKLNNKSSLIIIKNFDSFFINIKSICDVWDLPFCSNCEILDHSDIFVTIKSKARYCEFFQLLKPNNKADSFGYNNFKFNLHLPTSELDINVSHKLLSFINPKDKSSLEIYSFNKNDYFSSLKTENLGQIVLFGEVLGSSYDFMDRFVNITNCEQGLIAISKVQTGGKGRGINKWISPLGCAMFTCSASMDISSHLGKSMCLIQHIMAVSIVESICCEFDIKKDWIKIKWPNDIYWVDHGKISGIISKGSVFSTTFCCILGCGINVSNSEPTFCIHDIIKASNISCTKLPSIETIIAFVMNYFEANISAIQSHSSGLKKFKDKYYNYWMHRDQNVTVKNGTKDIKGRIIGINDYGFLEMVTDDTDKNGKKSVMMLHPDGNSFDMMHNLITPKK